MDSTAIADAARTFGRAVLTAPRRRQMWGELIWVTFGVPLAMLSLLPVLIGLLIGGVLTAVFAGLLIIGGTLLLARSLGGLHRRLGRALLAARVAEPGPPPLRPGLWRWITGRIGDPVAWRTVGYLLLRLPVAALNLAVVAPFLLYGLGTITYPVLRFSYGDQEAPYFGIRSETWLGSLPIALTGLLILLVLPWVLHGLSNLDRLLMRGLLGRSTLSTRIRDLERTRAAAVADDAARLRRIERDLHDGAQAQLVAVAMKLGVARTELAATDGALDSVRLGQLVDSAQDGVKRALTELRDLARGIHPAALDAGLGVALDTLVAGMGADVSLRIGEFDRPPPELETMLYFSTSELLANAAKHGEIDGAAVNLSARPDGALRLVVTDPGPGGAELAKGGGLTGLADRVRAVDGELRVHSPPGGPTMVTVDIPTTG